MNGLTGQPARYPDSVAVIGGGRWARVIVQVLSESFPDILDISVYSRRNADAMRTWVAQGAFAGRVTVLSDLPRPVTGKTLAVVIANAARDHEKLVEWAIGARLPVLVEKPFTLTASASRRLAESAQKNGVRLATAHVFLFARYMAQFARLIAESGLATSLQLRWSDPAAERRYGEVKRYDASLPVPADLLPHVMSIIEALMPRLKVQCEYVNVLRGGAQVELGLAVAGTKCFVHVARNAKARSRTMEVVTERGGLQLDFSNEPGIATRDGETLNCDPEWDTASRPLAQTLTAFLKWAAGNEGDHRLDPGIGVKACGLIDEVMSKYYPAQISWLNNHAAAGSKLDEDVAYALTELLAGTDPATALPNEEQLQQMWERLTAASGQSLKQMLAEPLLRDRVIREIALEVYGPGNAGH